MGRFIHGPMAPSPPIFPQDESFSPSILDSCEQIMNTKLFSSLIIAVALLAAGPAFGYGGRGGGGGGGGFHGRSFSSGGRSFAFGGSRGGGYGYSRGGYGYGRGYGYRRYGYGGYGYVYPYYYGGYPYDYGYDYAQPAYTVYGNSYDNDDSDSGGGAVSVAVQRELAHDGYYHGPIDGIVGPATQAAITAYQRDNGLRPTGAINSRLLDALDLN
jgi:hypothetical protein